MSMPSLKPVSEPRISAQKLHFIDSALTRLGIQPGPVLRKSISRLSNKDEISQTVSMSELINVYEELARIDEPGIGLKIGQQVACGDYGLFGCTLLCKRTLEDALYFSYRYHTLVTRTTRLYLNKGNKGVHFYGCSDILHHPDIANFNLEMQVAINLALIREILGKPDFAPVLVSYSFKKPAYAALLEDYARCEVRFKQTENGIEMREADIQTAPAKANPLAVPLLLKSCEEHQRDFLHRSETVERVYNLVSQNIHNELKIDKVANELCMSERTLRRKLAEGETSFSTICKEIKLGFAKKYIQETKLSYDDISESLGFKDPSNFRRAFKVWTGLTPKQFRQQCDSNG